MKRSNPKLWTAGWVGLAGGLLLAAIGIVATDEVLNLAGGYGLLVAGAALYLLVGLTLRASLARRGQAASRVSASGQPVTQR